MNVLIVEDDIDFRETLTSEFEDVGHRVYFCNELPELNNLEVLIDYAVVDLRLKDESGLNFIEAIRSKFPNVRMTMLTAFGSVATTVKAIKAGADNYILKPCSFSELLMVLEGDETEPDEVIEVPGLYKKEREYIEYVLSLHDGNITKTAEALGIRRQSLQRKLKKYPPIK